jgi:hypothetical protein
MDIEDIHSTQGTERGKNWPENKVGLGWNLTWHSSGDLLTDMYLYTIRARV